MKPLDNIYLLAWIAFWLTAGIAAMLLGVH
jgi:hypothetical protein